MSPSRRIYLYWFLLLIPTLVAGVVALQLLRREQARIVSRSGELDRARRDALVSRARLAVENLELTAGDVETALLDALAETSEADLPEFLKRWPAQNPLVRTAFLWSPEGRLLVPTPDDPSETGRAFRLRLEPFLRYSPPWGKPRLSEAQYHKSSRADAALSSSRRSAPDKKSASAKNFGWAATPALPEYHGAGESRIGYFDTKLPGAGAASHPLPAEPPKGSVREDSQSSTVIAYNSSGSPARAREAGNIPLSTASKENLLQSNTAQVQNIRRDVQQLARASRSSQLQKAEALEIPKPSEVGGTILAALAPHKDQSSDDAPAAKRQGWAGVVLADRVHLLGWVQPSAEAVVRGLELDFARLIPRLVALLPSDLASGESIALLDAQGRLQHRTGASFAEGTPPAVHIPVGSALLKGWSVEARLSPALYAGSDPGDSFFFVGALLVCILLVAILAGGSLLLWQARASTLEAVQKSSFVSNVSHEFKTPLTTIRLYAELLEQQRVPDPVKRAEYLRTISRETQRLARLVGNVLDFSRLEQGRKRYQPESLDLAAEVARLLEAHQPRLSEVGLAASFERPNSPVCVRADRDAVEQILLNLLDNACKYAASGGELYIALESARLGEDPGNRAGGGVSLLLGDRGPGVPEDQRERIFEKFHRVDDRLTADQSGAGLGLSIARRLARDLGGDLTCHARPDGGALFRLRLPAAAAPESLT